MKIKDINIDRFGVWRDLSLPLNERGVTVFYGPNEAGKSTLMRFVRGTLYGFDSHGERIGESGVSRSDMSRDGKGSLRIIDHGREHTIARETELGKRGRVRVDDLDGGTLSENRIQSFLSGTSEEIFENIFAIGLQELQELATLDGDEVAQHIYGLSLGPDGERILHARTAFEREQALLVSSDHKSGQLVELASRLADIDRQLAEVGDVSQKHAHLRAERERLTNEIEQAEYRRRNLQDNLRGYRYLERVHGPWSRERKLRQEQSALPMLASFPTDGLSQYDRFSRDLDENKRNRSRLLSEAKRLYNRAGEQTGDTSLLQHECTIRRLADERDDMKHRERRLSDKQLQADKIKRQLQTKLNDAGGRWSTDRLSDSHTPVAGLSRLLEVARAYQRAGSKKSRAVKKYKSLVSRSQQRQNQLTERLKPLGSLSLVQAIKSTRRRLLDVEELNRLRLEEARLLGQTEAQTRPRRSTSVQGFAGNPKNLLNFRDLPPLFYLIMWFFTMAGFTLFVLGLWGAITGTVAAGNTAWIVGGIYSCFGLCMAGVTWTVRQHFEQFFEGGLEGDTTFSLLGKTDVVEEPPRYDPDADQHLTRVRQSIGDLVQKSHLPGLKEAYAEGGELIGSDVLIRTSQRLADLEGLRKDEERVQSDRKRLSRYRETLRGRQRDVGLRRREWCDCLRDLGLDETLKVDRAIDQWQAIVEASDLRREHAAFLELIERDQKAIESHRRDIDRLIGLLPTSNMVGLKSDPDRLITHWLGELKNSGGLTEEQAKLRREGREKRKEASRLESLVRDLESQTRMLLMQAGVSSRDELEHRTHSLTKHQEITRLLEDTQGEVRMVGEEEPDLAISEDDLLAFNSTENKRRLGEAETELQQIFDHDIQTAREELGRVKRELTELANDRRAVSLRVEREQIADELRQATERWCALDLSIDSVDRIRHRMERHAQSATLKLASEYLSKLTVGRYNNIWSPLGERHLCIDDDAEQTLKAEQLSTGTREQLFLAIRLAMIGHFANEGTELPMVLDDVFVNFDQDRTEAAVDTILDVSAAGQQVLLLTCHAHLADLFEDKGVDVVNLPTNQATLEERRAG